MNAAKALSLLILLAGSAHAQSGGFVAKVCDAAQMPPYYAGRNYRGACYFDPDGALSYWVVRLWRPNDAGGGPDPAAPVVVGSTLFVEKQRAYNAWAKSEPLTVNALRSSQEWENTPGRLFKLTVQTPEEMAANDERQRQLDDALESHSQEREWERAEASGRAAAQEASKLDRIRDNERFFGRPAFGLSSHEEMLLNMPKEQARALMEAEAAVNAYSSSDPSGSRRGLSKQAAESFVVADSDYRVNPHGWLHERRLSEGEVGLRIPSEIAETGAINRDTLSAPMFRLGVQILAADERVANEIRGASQIFKDLSRGEYDFYNSLPPDNPLSEWQKILTDRRAALEKAEELSRQSAGLIATIEPGELPAEVARQLASLQASAEGALRTEEALAKDCARMTQRFERLDKLSPAYIERTESSKAWEEYKALERKAAERDKRLQENQQRLRDERDAWCRENPDPALCN